MKTKSSTKQSAFYETQFTRRALRKLRAIALLLIMTFTVQQIAWAGEYQMNAAGAYQPVKQAEVMPDAIQGRIAERDLHLGETHDFLSDTLSLTTPGDIVTAADNSHERAESPEPEAAPQVLNRERYDFDYALAELEQGLAAAVIVESLSAENVRALLDLDFETGVAVMEGEIVLFTSGDYEEVRVHPAALVLLEKADFIAHTHVAADKQSGPSTYDLSHAVAAPSEEYVITRRGVYAYNSQGVQNYGVASDYKSFTELLNTAVEESVGDAVSARSYLNQFLTDMAAAHEEAFAETERFRASEETPVSLLNQWATGVDWAAEFLNGQAAAVQNADGRLEEAVFDANQNLVSGIFTDDLGRRFEFENGSLVRASYNGETELYDAAGYVIEKTFADSTVKSYKRQFDANGVVTDLTVYDGPLSSIPDPIVLAAQETVGAEPLEVGSSTIRPGAGQTIRFDTGTALDSVDFQVTKYGYPTGSVKAKVYTFGDGTSPGTLIAESLALDVSEFDSKTATAQSNASWHNFEFADAVLLNANENYWITFEKESDFLGDGANYVTVYMQNNGASYPAGYMASFYNGVSYPLDRDLSFRVHGYDGSVSGPAQTRYSVDAAGDLLDDNNNVVTSTVIGSPEGFTVNRVKPLGMAALETSFSGLLSQTAALTSADSVDVRAYSLDFSLNGFSFSAAKTLQAGDNLVSHTYTENGHNVTMSWNVFSDTFPPIVEQESDSVTHSGETQLAYYLDGILTVETVYLNVGRNVIVREFTNEWGTTTKEFILDYEPVLEDGTILRYKNGVLNAAEKAGLLFDNIILDTANALISATIITAAGERIVVDAGEVKEIHSPDGRLRKFVDEYITEDLKIGDLPLFFSRLFDASQNVTELTVQEGSSDNIPDPMALAVQEESGAEPLEVGSSTTRPGAGQRIRFDSDVAIDSADFEITKYGYPTGSVRAKIYTYGDGSSPGTLIAESLPLDVSGLDSKPATSQSNASWQNLQFADPVLLNANENYWVTFEKDTDFQGDGANFLLVYMQHNNASYPNGDMASFYNGVSYPIDRDLSFRLHGYEGGLPGPTYSTFGVNSSGQLLDENGAVTTSAYVPYQEGFVVQTDAAVQTLKEGGDLTDVMAHAINYRIPPVPPVAELLSVATVKDANYTLQYKVGETTYEQTHTLVEGENRLQVIVDDELGQTKQVDFWITLDTTPPVMELVSDIITNQSSYLLRYLVDGDMREETIDLTEGDNTITRQATDVAGNLSEITVIVTYDPYYEPFETFSRPDGTIEYIEYLDGTAVYYEQDAASSLKRYDENDVLIETISDLSVPVLDESTAMRLTMEDGTYAFYVDGEMVEMRGANGIRVTDFVLDQYDEIVDAQITYPNGTIEIIRNGFLVRRVNQDGSMMDFLPTGRGVREIFSDRIEYFEYTKDVQGRIIGTRVFTMDGNSVQYDDMGILNTVTGSDGKYFKYDRAADGSNYALTLDTALSSAVSDQTMVAAVYSADGVPLSMNLHNGTQLIFENGLLKQAVNAGGDTVDYAPVASQGLIDGLQVVRGDTTFNYDDNGFLASIDTLQGTIHRIAEDTDGDGDLTDEQIVDILIEEVGGNRLSDFELDADGNIIQGIIETKEGVKQFIANGVLTGYETIDGRRYDFGTAAADGSRTATLSAWNFKDGTRVTYGGGDISEILFPDGRRLHTLGFNADKIVETFTEQLADGTIKDYEDNRLVRMQSPDGTQIFYNRAGMAENIILADGSNQDVSYAYDSLGNVIDIRFDGEFVNRTFLADGSLTSLLKAGVRADIANDEVQKLFTRFGEIETPTFDNNLMTGNVAFADGAMQTIENGVLTSMALANGNVIDYTAGRISRVVTSLDTYHVQYVDNAQNTDLLDAVTVRVGDDVNAPDQALVPFLLESVDTELAQILLPHELHDAAADRSELASDLLPNGSSIHKIAVAKLLQDSERGSVYAFESMYSPNWQNVSTGGQGYVNKHEVLDIWDNLPARTAGFYDLNGDGLKDRVYTDGSTNYWLWQQGTPDGFLPAAEWQGVDRTTLQHSSYNLTVGALVYYEGRHPHKLGDLTDVNGDGLPDRVLQKIEGTAEWFVQLNNGNGFDAIQLWEDNVQPTSQISTQAEYATQVRDDGSGYAYQPLIAEFIDMDGDGLKDRVVRPYVAPFTHWFFQKNNGAGFEDTLLWEGVDTSFHADPKVGGSLSWYGDDLVYDVWADQSLLKDMNGDSLPDRVLLKPKDAGNPNGLHDWYVQLNNGGGFNEAVLWDDDVRAVPGTLFGRFATAAYAFNTLAEDHRVFSDLIDVTGDGKPDRVTANTQTGASSSWWVEVNTGETFEPAVEWTGIYGSTGHQSAIRFDNDHFISSTHGGFPPYIKQTTDLQDMNGDQIPDRVIYVEGTDEWLVQLGTGSGFLPPEAMRVEALHADTSKVRTDIYDYIHISLKTAVPVTAAEGRVKVSLGDPADTDAYQEWTIEDLSGTWQDIYLPLDATQFAANEIRVELEHNDPLLDVEVLVDNMTFVTMRPKDDKEWLDRLLADESVLSEIDSEATQTLAQYLGFVDESDQETLLQDSFIDKLLKAEMRIDFNGQNETVEFENHYGSVSEVTNGAVSKTTLSDGTEIVFDTPDVNNPNETVQTTTHADGTVETQTLSYGRVRSVSKTGESDLEYSYEFVPVYTTEDEHLKYSYPSVLATGTEITVVHSPVVAGDPESGQTERYAEIDGESKLISRTKPNGVVTIFEYDVYGELTKSMLVYKGRVREIFEHKTSDDGYQTVTTEAGVTEAYDDEGKVVYHTTAEGYRYTHSFDTAKEVITTITEETAELADGTTATFEVPVVTLADCVSDCEDVHRVSLESYKAENGEYATYDGSELKTLKTYSGDVNGSPDVSITFDAYEEIEVEDTETGNVSYESRVLDATVIHEDGTITEFKNGLPFSVTKATGDVIVLAPAYVEQARENPDQAELLNPTEAASFHYTRARLVWNNLVTAKAAEFKLANEREIQIEYDLQGKIQTRQFAEGSIELYDEGNLDAVLAGDGERMIDYTYDAEGNIVRVTREGTRRRLEKVTLQARADLAVKYQTALAVIAEREQVINQTVEGQYTAQRERLLVIRNQLEEQRASVTSIKVKGKKAKSLLGDAVSKIDVNMNQVNQALTNLANQRADALAQLAEQVGEAKDKVEADTQEAYSEIDTQEASVKENLLRQELTPVIYHWYRKIMGRDPHQTEFDTWMSSADFNTGEFDLEVLKSSLLSSQEYTDRSAEVQAIKDAVEADLQSYKSMDQSQREAFAISIGMDLDFLVELSDENINSILNWLLNQSLHFGQSAYISLEAMLDDAGLSYSRLELARKLILIDILTGTITTFETDDLVLSLYAMRKVAEGYGLAMTSIALDYDALLSMYNEECPDPEAACDFRFVAHVDGNHFIIVTKVTATEITYIDPGIGPEGTNAVNTLTMAQFLDIWLAPDLAGDNFGFIFAPRGPPQEAVENGNARVLESRQEMEVRGAFWPVIFWIAVAVFALIGIVTQIEAILNSLKTLAIGVWEYFKGIFTLNFALAWEGLKKQFYGALQFTALIITSPIVGFTKSLKFVGVPDHVADTIGDGVQIAVGVALLFTPAYPIGIGLITGGATNILNRYVDLPPGVTAAITATAATIAVFAGGYIDPGSATSSFAGGVAALKETAPYLAAEFASAGVVGVGDALNLDPRFTGMLSMSVRLGVNSLANGVGGGDLTNADITMSQDVINRFNGNYGSLGEAGAQGFTVPFYEVTGTPGLNELVDTAASSASSSLFSELMTTLKEASISAANFIGPKVAYAATTGTQIGVFNDMTQLDGMENTLRDHQDKIFDRPTIEHIRKQTNGISDLLNTSTNEVTLPDGATAFEREFSSTTKHLYDSNGDFIGQIKNGRYEIGEFEITNTEFNLKNGYTYEELGSGTRVRVDVQNGKIQNISVHEMAGNELVSIESKEGIFIKGPDLQPQFDGDFNVSMGNLTLIYKQGKLDSADMAIAPSEGESEGVEDELLYLLVNGINNSANVLNSNGEPKYFGALKQDLNKFDPNIDPNNDVATASIYPNLPALPGFLSGLSTNLNRFLDVIQMQIEANTPFAPLWVVADILKDIKVNDLTRPVLGLGYSGGFAPMLEAMKMLSLDTKMIVGVGAATINLSEIRDVLNMLINSIFALTDEVVLNQNFGDFVKRAKNIVGSVYNFTFGRLPVIGPLFEGLFQLLFGTVSKTMTWVEDAVQFMVDMVGEVLEKSRIQWVLSNISLLGLSDVDGADGVLNIFGDRDLLVDLGIAGKMSNIAGFAGQDVLDIEIKSYTDLVTGLTAVADHYIYMGDIRTYSDIDDPLRRDLQKQFDKKVADFVAELVARAKDQSEALIFLNEQIATGFVKVVDGTYEFHPNGVV